MNNNIKEIKKTSLLFKRTREAFNTTKMVLSWGGKIWKDFSPGSDLTLVDQIWEPFLKCKDLKSFRNQLKQWKTVRVWLMKILGSSTKEKKLLLSCPPKGTFKWVFNFLKIWLLDSSPWKKRALMTILFSTRALITEGDPDYSTITQASDKLTPSYGVNIQNFWRKLRVNKITKRSRRLSWRDWHLTSKQGPNGPALSTLLRDFNSLDENDRMNIEILGGPRLSKALKTLDIVNPWFSGTQISTQKGRLRKLSNFGDIEGKTRIIGVLDYFSQSVLRPLHSWLFSILRKIPQDFTFDQGGFRNYICDWKDFYSCDLSAATDRFPISVISEVLSGVLPKDYITAWESLMVKIPFEIPGGNSLSYARGNPMGAYSSWASFTLAHHFVVFQCCKNIGINWATARYAMLGDDILIGDTDLYNEYRKVLKELDIPVSEPKTHESKTLCEFAKRWIYKGQEITPFPIPAMMECRNYSFLTALLCQEKVRGYETDIPSSVRLWFENVNSNKIKRSGKEIYLRRGHYQRLEILSTISEGLIQTFRKELSWEDLFKRIYPAVTSSLSLEPHMDSGWIASFWGHFLRDLWLKSSDSHMIGQYNYHSNPSQGDPAVIWQQIMMEHMFELDNLTEDGTLDVKLIPWVSISGQLTATSDESYYIIVQLLKGKLSNLEGWEAVRRLVLPDLGTVFRERKHNIIRVLAGKLSSDLVKILTGKKWFVHIPYYNKGILSFEKVPGVDPLLGLPNLGTGRFWINPLSPDISRDTWGEESKSADKDKSTV